MLFTAVSGQAFAGNSGEPIVFAEGDWPGIWAKDAVATSILEKIGYNTETKMIGEALIYKGLANGNIDVFLGSWMPATKKKREAVKNEIEVVKTNMDGCIYTMAVPTYTWEAGVKSYSDLDKYAEKFDHKLYVGPTGWDSSINMSEAIKNNTYNLGDWEAINSSQSALIAHVKKAIKDKEWVVFVGWKPHWMNYILDIKYLQEPARKIWDNPESYVDTLTRTGFKEDHPEVYKFLKRFEVKVESGDKWVYEIGRKEKDPAEVAEEWIKNNIPTIQEWLKGIKAANGKKAVEVLNNNL